MAESRDLLETHEAVQTTRIGEERAEAPTRRDEIPRGTTFGRYVILAKIGTGGMGAVYAAYDQELDRKVALKLLHIASTVWDANASARLIREAQAMARLSHPNVIAVHDVGASEGRLFIAMELVEGVTLKEWLAQRPRSWREILEVFKAAGRGIAAAHAVGIVHRDFKPSNVVIGKDGRARVTDFGLARATGARVEPELDLSPGGPPPASDPLATPLTGVGNAVGTPGYMAPEQYSGQPADTRSDQYGFCAALYEALYAEPAFRGEPYEIAAQVDSGKLPQPPKGGRVPKWVERVVLRGLRNDPNERYATMEALLDDLGRDRSALRRRWALGASVALVVAGLAGAYAQAARRQVLVCKGAERKLAGIWDDGRKRAIGAAFQATGKSSARDTLIRVEQVIDTYTRAWVAMHTEACEATRLRGEQSDELLSLRMSCLGQRLEEVKALGDLFLKADGVLVQNASKAAHSLTAVADCGDSAALLSPVKLPTDTATRLKVDAVRQDLAKATAMRISGKYKEGFELATSLASTAQAVDYKPLWAEALNNLGQLETELGDYAAAERDLTSAMLAAEASRHDTVAAEAAAKLVYVVGYKQERFDEGVKLGRQAEALVERAGTGGVLEVDFLLSMATVHAVAGHVDEALEADERALEIIEKAPESYGDRWGRGRNNFGVHLQAAGRFEEAIAQYQNSMAAYEQLFGPTYPRLVLPLGNVAVACARLGRYREARPYADRALSLASSELGPDHTMTGWVLSGLGDVLTGQGAFEEAAMREREALAVLEKTLGLSHSWVADAARSLADARRGQGRIEEARRWYARAIDIDNKTPDPGSTGIPPALAGLGQLHLHDGAPARAIELLERGVQVTERNREYPLARASMRFTLARALTEVGRDKERAIALAREAREIYAKSGADEQQKLVGEIDAWLGLNGS